MLTLRLARAGTKKRPVYHLVAADKRARRDGRFVENLGYYIPGRNVMVIRQDRVDYWLSVGAATTGTADQLIKRAKVRGNVEPQAKPKYEPPPAKPKAEEPKAEAKEPKAETKPAEGEKKAEAKPEEPKAPEAAAAAEAPAEETPAEKSE